MAFLIRENFLVNIESEEFVKGRSNEMVRPSEV